VQGLGLEHQLDFMENKLRQTAPIVNHDLVSVVVEGKHIFVERWGHYGVVLEEHSGKVEVNDRACWVTCHEVSNVFDFLLDRSQRGVFGVHHVSKERHVCFVLHVEHLGLQGGCVRNGGIITNSFVNCQGHSFGGCQAGVVCVSCEPELGVQPIGRDHTSPVSYFELEW